LFHLTSISENNTFLDFTTMRRFLMSTVALSVSVFISQLDITLLNHTLSFDLSLSHFIIIIKSFPFLFLLNAFILFILIMFCFNLTESNITLEIFFDTSEIIFLNWRDEKTNHKQKKTNTNLLHLFFIFKIE
jgi:hypothetical protein